MKAVTLFLLSIAAALTGCVSIKSNSLVNAVPPNFRRVLIVTKMRNAPDSYVRQFARAFPPGYEVCTLALSPLSFDKPDDAIRKQLESCHSEVILTVELIKTGHYAGRYSSYPYEFNAEMQSVASGQPFWKAIITSNPSNGEQVPPLSIVRRLEQDHILDGKLRASDALQAANE